MASGQWSGCWPLAGCISMASGLSWPPPLGPSGIWLASQEQWMDWNFVWLQKTWFHICAKQPSLPTIGPNQDSVPPGVKDPFYPMFAWYPGVTSIHGLGLGWSNKTNATCTSTCLPCPIHGLQKGFWYELWNTVCWHFATYLVPFMMGNIFFSCKWMPGSYSMWPFFSCPVT